MCHLHQLKNTLAGLKREPGPGTLSLETEPQEGAKNRHFKPSPQVSPCTFSPHGHSGTPASILTLRLSPKGRVAWNPAEGSAQGPAHRGLGTYKTAAVTRTIVRVHGKGHRDWCSAGPVHASQDHIPANVSTDIPERPAQVA